MLLHNILGIGTDIVYIPRIIKILSNNYKRIFLNKIYTKNEINIGKKYKCIELRAKYFAKRFAAKEAFIKAISNNGSTIIKIKMKDIEIYNDIKGKPYFNIHKNFISKNYIFHLSLSDDGNYAIAFVIIYKL